jgi:hypothetical protein
MPSYRHPLRSACWLHGRRTAAIGRIALTMSVAAVVGPIGVFESSLAAQAAESAKARVAALTPAPGQPVPTDLWRSAPIPAVVAAARSAKHYAPLPQAIVPSTQELEQENTTGSSGDPPGCAPTFASSATARICRLGDSSSTRVVAAIGDSHAGNWVNALVVAARAQHFAVVPLNKGGCFVNRVNINLPGRPCARWYRWALAQDKALHPVATIVTFELGPSLQAHPASTVSDIKSVLSQVRNGVLITDPPGQDQQPPVCLSQSNANMGKCSTRVPNTYLSLMTALSRMTTLTHHPAIPTLQWFCAYGICPMVIDNTLTTRDKSHMTKEYSTDLAPLLGLELKPILARLERQLA